MIFENIFENIFLNIYYVGVATALLIRDILWLRIVMIIAGSSVITYGMLIGNNVVIAWNTLFISINIIQVIRLIIERRPVKIDENIVDIFENVFPEMSRHEFIYFWRHGEISKTIDGLLCKSGNIQNKLLLIINGKASVCKKGNEIAQLGRGSFVAEMGFITSKPASADVIADGKVKYITWSRDVINKMKRVYPDLENKLQVIIGKDLVHKLEGSL